MYMWRNDIFGEIENHYFREAKTFVCGLQQEQKKMITK